MLPDIETIVENIMNSIYLQANLLNRIIVHDPIYELLIWNDILENDFSYYDVLDEYFENLIQKILINMLQHKQISIKILSWIAISRFSNDKVLMDVLNHPLINNNGNEYVYILFKLAQNINATSEVLMGILNYKLEFDCELIVSSVAIHPNASPDVLMAALQHQSLYYDGLLNIIENKNANKDVLMSILKNKEFIYFEYICHESLSRITTHPSANSLEILINILLLAANELACPRIEEDTDYIAFVEKRILAHTDLYKNIDLDILNPALYYWDLLQNISYFYDETKAQIYKILILKNNQLIYIVTILFKLLSNDNQQIIKDITKINQPSMLKKINKDILFNILELAFGRNLLSIINIINNDTSNKSKIYLKSKHIELDNYFKPEHNKHQEQITDIEINRNIVTVPGDGNCFYHAVRLYLPNTTIKDIDVLRNQVADVIEDELRNNITNNAENYRQMIATESLTEHQYITNIRNSNVWADHLQIIALMRVLRRPIYLVNNRNEIINTMDVEVLQNNIEFGTPIFVHYNGINHYNGLIYQNLENIDNVNDWKCLKTPHYTMLCNSKNFAKKPSHRRSLSYEDNCITRFNTTSFIQTKTTRRFSY